MDSDSDTSIKDPPRSSNKDFFLDSDSDDDALLKAESTFKRKSSTRKHALKVQSILGDALKTSHEQLEVSAKINEIKKRSSSSQLLVDSDLANSAKRLRQEKKDAQLQAKRQKPKSLQAKEREEAMAETRDTQLTAEAGSRSILSLQNNLITSSVQSTEFLVFTLSETNKNNNAAIVKAFQLHFKENSLVDFLSTRRLLAFDQKDLESLPSSILSWLFHVAISVDPEYAQGAFATLSSLWKNRQGFSDNGWFLACKDLPNQVQEWFGVNIMNPGAKPLALNTATIATDDSSSCALSVTRFLQLWEVALSQNMVYMDSSENISKCILSLMVISVDPIFSSSQTRANNPLNCLQKTVQSLLNAAKHLLNNKEEEYDKFTSQLVQDIVKTIGRLGPAISRHAVDHDDENAWICQARVIRTLMVLNNESCVKVASQLSSCVLAKCFSIEPKVWRDKSFSVLANQWNVSPVLPNAMSWNVLASSFLAISELDKKFPYDIDEAMCPAVVEIAAMALQAAIALDLWGSGTKVAIYTAYDQLEKQLENILSQSKGLALGNPHYLKVDRFCTCLRQYPRLEKRHFSSGETRIEQATLDSFLHSTGPKVQASH